jgi:hypothetical protein
MSPLFPLLVLSGMMISGGVALIRFRGPVSRWFAEQHGTVFGRPRSRSARAFNPSTLTFVGCGWIGIGVLALTLYFTRST